MKKEVLAFIQEKKVGPKGLRQDIKVTLYFLPEK